MMHDGRHSLDVLVQQYGMLHEIYVLLDDGDQRVFQPFGLSSSQYSVLNLLDQTEGRRLSDVSDHLLRARSTITRIVDQLEAARLVQRTGDPHDRRAQRVVLTDEGARRRDEARAAHLNSLQRRLTALSPDESRSLNVLLDRLRRGLHADLNHPLEP